MVFDSQWTSDHWKKVSQVEKVCYVYTHLVLILPAAYGILIGSINLYSIFLDQLHGTEWPCMKKS